MGRGPKPAKGEAKPAVSRQSPKSDDARVRDLETRLAESLEREKAAGEILRVISSSPASVQPTFEAIARAAMSLCEADIGSLFRFDGQLIHVGAFHGTPKEVEASRRAFPQRPGHGSVTARAILAAAVVQIDDVSKDPEAADALRAFRTVLSVPMIREGRSLGAITVARRVVRPFSDEQIELVKTFADQAVIAIENVRLFTELQEKNHALTKAHAQVSESLEQQTATGEILQVISSSPTDVQPVFEAIARNARQLLDGHTVSVCRRIGDELRLMAFNSRDAAGEAVLKAFFPIRLDRIPVVARLMRERTPVVVTDTEADPEIPEGMRRLSRARGWRSVVWMPMVRESTAIGVIAVSRREPRGFGDGEVALLQTFADQAVIAIENVRLFNDTKEALDRQTATSEILRVISSSPTDVQPVFEAVLASGVRLCGARFGGVFRFDGELIHLVTSYEWPQEQLEEVGRHFPMPPGDGSLVARAIRDRQVVQTPDYVAEARAGAGATLPAWVPLGETGPRSTIAIPMMREGNPLGGIVLARAEPGLFSDQHVALLQTFADQAVIAIENTRLFNETKEALEQQTATGEILRVIASSPTDIQPVLDTVAESAARLCESFDSAIWRQEGEQLRLVAHHGPIPATILPIVRGTIAGRAVLEARTLHFANAQSEGDEFPESSVNARREGWRSILSVPLMREGVATGAIVLRRPEARLFTERQVALLQTFADQAVIAIENVRLFTELQEKNQALTKAHAQVTEALEQKTAASEVLRVISQSPTDVQPVFDAIAESAVRLCDAEAATVTRFDGEWVHIGAIYGLSAARSDALRGTFPMRPSGAGGAARAIRDRAIVHIPDVLSDQEYEIQQTAMRSGYRAVLAVPMLHKGHAIGAITLGRAEPGEFSDTQVQLLRTFAAQAVIAIENVRLFKELETRTQELTRSVDELTALGDVSRALSSTLDLETVLQTIVTRANQIAGTAGCTIWEYDEPREDFRLRASHYADDADAAVLQALGRVTTLRRGQGVTTQVMERRQPVQIHDITAEGAYESPIRRPLIEAGHRALLGVPLLSEDQVIGVLAVTRKSPGAFEPAAVQLLTTFATQSALAIQNARLFREIEDKSRQLEVASQHKSEFLANMSHELRTPLNAIIGFSEVLGERMFGELNEKQEEYLKDIYASGQHLLSLINDILDLSKIEAGRMELELTDFNLPATLDNALTLVRERAGRRGIALGLTVDERLEQIRADERKIRQVVLNLLSNAIKFTPEGGRIEVRAVPVDGMVEIAVSDTGVGIAPEDQEAIFEEFKQVGTAAKKVEGTGLGLALSQKFVELHGGRIWVTSALGAGSTFTFTIPARRGE
jgi:GAF domain-containing protein